MLIEDADYTIRLVDGLPSRIRCYVTEDGTGYYNIYANATLSREQMSESVRHELAHIENNDLRSDMDADAIEYSAHEKRPRTGKQGL